MTSQNNFISHIRKLLGIAVPTSPDALPIGYSLEQHPSGGSDKKHWR